MVLSVNSEFSLLAISSKKNDMVATMIPAAKIPNAPVKSARRMAVMRLLRYFDIPAMEHGLLCKVALRLV